MVPRTFVFESLEGVKTPTGKIQKQVLRQRARDLNKKSFSIVSADEVPIT